MDLNSKSSQRQHTSIRAYYSHYHTSLSPDSSGGFACWVHHGKETTN